MRIEIVVGNIVHQPDVDALGVFKPLQPTPGAITMQRVELNTFYDIDLHCPFCGQKVVNYGSDGSEPGVSSCPHTAFSASDEGFDYRSPAFNKFFKLGEDDEIDVDELGFDHIDGMTDAYQAVDGIKFAQYVGPPGGMGGYVGFVPDY